MRKTIAALLLFSALLVLPISADAAEFKSGQSVYIGKNDTINDNVFAAGNSVTVDGVIKGDLICAASSITINGRVEGDLICAGQNVNINGEITGNVRTAASSVYLNNKVGRNFMAAGGFVNLGSNTQINEDATIGAGNGEVRGKVGRDLTAAGGNILISGNIGRNAKLWVDQNVKQQNQFNKNNVPLSIADKSTIGGNLEYTSSKTADISPDASIKGEVKHKAPKNKEANKSFAGFYGWMKIVSLFSYLIIGLVLVSLWREETIHITDLMREKIGPSFGWGLIVLFLTPIIIIALMFTLIGIPLALILFAIWMIAVYVSKIIAGIYIGRELIERFWRRKSKSLITAMVIGIIILWIVCMIPLIGWLICLLATLWGLGGIWLFFRKA